MSDATHIQLRSFVLGANHGQYLQAAGLARAVAELAPNARVTHAHYHNHLSAELKVQTRSLLLPKYCAMRAHWARNISFSPPGAKADITVYGADQIWSFSNPGFPPDPFYFGVGDQARKISYAPAMGHVESEFGFPTWARHALGSFESLSVRDRATQRAVAAVSTATPKVVVDPAFFLCSLSGEAKTSPLIKRLAIYCPRARHTVPMLQSAGGGYLADWPTDLLGYVPRRLAWRLDAQLRKPEAVLARIASSQFVFTSTFHGVIMALMTGTPFVALKSPSLLDRLDAPVGRETFGPHRLIDGDELKALDRTALDELLDASDLRLDRIKALVDQSRNWLGDAISAASDGLGKFS